MLSPYDPVIERQQRRIDELESELERSGAKLQILKTRHTLAHQLCDPNNANLWSHYQQQCRMNGVACGGFVGNTGGMMHGLPAPLTAEEDERAGKTRYWTEVEHNQFLWAVTCFGPKNYVAISQFVGTRTPKQVRTHAQKYQMKLEREASKRRATAAALAATRSEEIGRVDEDDGEEGKMDLDGVEKVDSLELMEQNGEGITGAAPPPTPAIGTQGGLDWLRDLSCSPVSRDSSEEDLMLSELGEDSVIPSSTMQVQATLKKNSSLANLADYDEFYKKLTNASNQKTVDKDEDMLDDSQPEASHFGDSLLQLE